jgi:hypothetical protein
MTELGSGMLGESESDLSRENVDHIISRFQETTYSIYNGAPPSESDSDDNCEVIMVGHNDALGDQTEEIAEATATKITRSKKFGEGRREGSREETHVAMRSPR